MKFPCIALLAAGLLAGVMVQAQTADEIVNKYTNAIGGKDKINSIKSLYIEEDLDVNGNVAPSVTVILNGKAFRNDVDFGGAKITRVTTPTSGWSVNPAMGQTTPEVTPAEANAAGAPDYQVGGALVDYAAKGYTVELQGTEAINGVNNHKLHVTSKAGLDITYYIDPSTFYITRSVSKTMFGGQSVEFTRNFSKYTKTDAGIVVPYSTELVLPQFTLSMTTKKVEANKDVDAKLFDMPK